MTGENAPLAVIVDDDALVRLVLQRMLERRGYEVAVGASGAEALRLVQRRPRCLFLDQNLPDMNGHAIRRAIRANPDFNEVRIVLISGDALSGAQIGAERFLQKPFDQDAVDAVLGP